MSEHMSIKGDIEFHHLPLEEEGSFSYCHHCKKPKTKLIIELHEGAMTSWIQVKCPKCRKTIWVAELTTEEELYPKSYGGKYIVKEKNKCFVCGKITNQWDCYAYTYMSNQRIRCFCSERCDKKYWRSRCK